MANKATTDTSDDDQPFRFMDLPREMRDKIYDNLTNDEMPVEIQPRKDGDGGLFKDLTATIENSPLATCLRISRRFSNEYAESIQRNQMTTLRLKDINQYYLGVPEFVRVAPLLHIHKLELQLATACNSSYVKADDHSKCSCFIDIDEHKSFINGLVAHSGFSRISQYHISVCFNRWHADLEDVVGVKAKSLADFSQVTTIDCYYCDYGLNSRGRPRKFRDIWEDKDLEKTLFLGWTRSHGWVESVPKAEDAGRIVDAAHT